MPSPEGLLRSALHDQHVAAGATMGQEAGWEIPLHYGSAEQEVLEARRRAGVIDLSHYGRIRIRGRGALDLLERACAADAGRQEDDTSIPAPVASEDGGVIDNCRLIRLQSFWVLITSPQRREEVLRHLSALSSRLDAKVDDQTAKTTMLAVMGPAAEGILQAVLPFSIAGLAAGQVKFGSVMVARYIAERADVSGLWGVQVSIPNMVAGRAWRFITQKAAGNAIKPVGLDAWKILSTGAGGPSVTS